MAKSYIVYNSPMATIAAPVKQPTGATIRTMMQLKFATGVQGLVVRWGFSYDASAAAVPGQVELIETGSIFATVTTAFAAADVQPYNDYNASANTAGASGVPLNLATTASGFASAAGTEGTIVASRMCDLQLIAPTNQYVYESPLGREFAITPQMALRVRATFPATVNMYCYIIFEI